MSACRTASATRGTVRGSVVPNTQTFVAHPSQLGLHRSTKDMLTIAYSASMSRRTGAVWRGTPRLKLGYRDTVMDFSLCTRTSAVSVIFLCHKVADCSANNFRVARYRVSIGSKTGWLDQLAGAIPEDRTFCPPPPHSSQTRSVHPSLDVPSPKALPRSQPALQAYKHQG